MYKRFFPILLCRLWVLLFSLTSSWTLIKADTLPVEQSIASLPELLSNATTTQLELMGNDYLLRKENPDSAALCYSVIVQRYNDHLLQSAEELRSAIAAMNALEYLNIYYYQDYRKAIAYIIESEHVAEHIEAKDKLPEIYNAIGDLHATLFNISAASAADTVCARQALDYFSQAYALSSEQQMWPQSVVAMINLVQIAEGLDLLDDVSDDMLHFRQQQIPDTVLLCRFSRLLCESALAKQQGDYAAALACYDNMEEVIDTDQTRGRCQLLIDLDRASLYGKMGLPDKQYQCYRDLLPWAQENDVKEVLVDAYRVFADYNARCGNVAEAERNQLLYLQHKDSLLNVRHAADIEYIQLFSDWKNREAEIVTWSRMNESQRHTIHLAILAALLLLAVCALLSWRYFRLQRRYQMLYEQNLQALESLENQKVDDKQQNEEVEDTHVLAPASPHHHVLQIRIRRVLELDAEIYSPEFSVRRLAEIVGEKYWLVSQVINDEWGKNFNTVLAEYRIMEACRRINDTEHYGHLTIEGIAQSVGIKSRSNFSNTFKQIVGMPPSEYQKRARK